MTCQTPCNADGTTCTLDRDCCSGTCTGGTCAPPVDCTPIAGVCTTGTDCCSGFCFGGRCESVIQ
jgi:hypothetical protein